MKEYGTQKKREIDPNTLACDTVMRSIAIFPQAGEGIYLIAERALGQLKGDNYQPSLHALASIDPDGKRSAEKVNSIHEKFGIPYKVGEDQAERFILTFALDTLDYVREKTVYAAAETHTEIPDDLRTPIRIDDFSKEYIDRDSIDRDRSRLLETTLREYPDILDRVYDEVVSEAADIKALAKEQREYSQERGKIFRRSKFD